MVMDPDYLRSGRANQKSRTRQALIDATVELLRQGQTPSVAEAADHARVSRTTAYRYFETQEALLAQAALFGAMQPHLRRLVERARGPGAPEERVDAVVAGDHQATMETEPLLKAVLRSTLTASTENREMPRRPAFRLRWFQEALAELEPELGERRTRHLVAALSLCVGIESLVVLQDLCGLKPVEAEAVKRWAARALLRAACAEAEAEAKAGAEGTRPARRGSGRARR